MAAKLAGQRQDSGRSAGLIVPRPLLARAVLGAGRGTWWTLRYAVFLPLAWARGPVLFVLGWMAALTFISLVLAFAFYIGPHRTYVLLGMLGVGLVATAIKHSAYDAVLRWVKPG